MITIAAAILLDVVSSLITLTIGCVGVFTVFTILFN